MMSAYEQRLRAHEALERVRHGIPRDLARDVQYYLDNARDTDLALDVLIDGLIEGKVILSLDEFDQLRNAMDANGRGGDTRLVWLEDHALQPIVSNTDAEDD